MTDVIRIDVPTFIRLLELAREEIKNDPDLHDVAEIVTRLSKEDVISMEDYDAIVAFMQEQGDDQDSYSDEEDAQYAEQMRDIRRLGGMNCGS
jgi:hypothetical protein